MQSRAIITITARFRGWCDCGARVAAGARIAWDRETRVTRACPACRPVAAAPVKVGDLSVTLYRRPGAETACMARVGIATAELSRPWLRMGRNDDGRWCVVGWGESDALMGWGDAAVRVVEALAA